MPKSKTSDDLKTPLEKYHKKLLDLSFRLPLGTMKQLDTLENYTDHTMHTVIIIAVEEYYTNYLKKMKKK